MRQSERLLHVGVFLRPGSRDGNRHVPVVGRGDDHGVDIAAGQQLAEIAVGLALDHSRVGLAAVFVGVGDGHALRALALLEMAKQLAAPVADADVSERHPFAGRRRIGVAQRGRSDDVRRGRGGRRARQETTPVEANMVHEYSPLLA